MDRRHFLKAAAAGVAVSALGGYPAVFAQAPAKRVALIGSGWYGKSALFRLLQIAPVEVVAICDADRNMMSEAAKMIAERQASKKAPRTYGDYRELLAKEKPEIVQISTPDHWHALPMIAAVQAGADVYVEKPVSVDIVEGQAMLAAARKYGRVVQVNTQRRSTPHLIEAKNRFIREGRLGKISHVEIYSYYHMRARGQAPDTAPPDHLDYEMWTGPAPMRPYCRMKHPRGWRAFMEYGNGIVGDMCIHMYDMVRWLLDLGWAKRVSSSGGIYVDKGSKANISDTQTATFEHDDMTVVWQHRTWGHPADPDYPWGATIYGENGTLKASVMRYDFIPRQGERVRQDVTYELEQYPEDRTEKDLERHVAPALRGHWRDFLDAVEKRTRPVADIEEGFISSTGCILANMSLELGRTLTWDAEKGCVAGDEEANRLLRRPYRAPWKHPEPDAV